MSDQLNQKRSFNAQFSNSNQGSGEVCIPVTKSLIPGLISYLEEYGEIENVTVSIRFKDETVAESVLRQRFHKIENRIWTTESPKESPQQSYAKKMKLVQSAHILDLSDEVLVNIFKRLDFVDLAHAAETCVRMDGLAKQFVASKFNSLKLDDSPDSADLIAVLPRFGDLVKELHLTAMRGNAQHFDSVLKYCQNVEHLWLRCINLETSQLFTTITASVKQLHLLSCKYPPYGFALFVKMMPDLQTLHIDNSYFYDLKLTAEFSKQLGQLKALKQLEIWCHDIAVQALLDSLWLGSVMIENITITACDWSPEPIDGIIDTITKLKTIKVLELLDGFYGILEEKHLVKLAKGLPLLSELDVGLIGMTIGGLKDMIRFAKRLTRMMLQSPVDAFGEADYQAILKTVKRRPEKFKLSLWLPYEDEIDRVVRDRNNEWLEIFL